LTLVFLFNLATRHCFYFYALLFRQFVLKFVIETQGGFFESGKREAHSLYFNENNGEAGDSETPEEARRCARRETLLF
jgi:hypothetical protein